MTVGDLRHYNIEAVLKDYNIPLWILGDLLTQKFSVYKGLDIETLKAIALFLDHEWFFLSRSRHHNYYKIIFKESCDMLGEMGVNEYLGVHLSRDTKKEKHL